MEPDDRRADPDPVVEAYKAGVDRSLIRGLEALAELQELADELRRAGHADLHLAQERRGHRARPADLMQRALRGLLAAIDAMQPVVPGSGDAPILGLTDDSRAVKIDGRPFLEYIQPAELRRQLSHAR